jgi:hypothetical protein
MDKELELERVEANGKYGFADVAGNVIIPCTWDYVYPFKEGLARVLHNMKYGFIDKTGTISIPCEWDAAYSFNDGLARIMDNNKKWGFIDKTGSVVVPCNWNSVEKFSEGLACVVNDEGYKGFIDTTGKVIISCDWILVDSFNGEQIIVVDEFNNRFTFDKYGNLLEFDLDDNIKGKSTHGTSTLHPIRKNSKYGYINKTGTVVIPCKWAYAKKFHEGLAAVQDKKGKWGFVDELGNNVIPCMWNDLGYLEEGLYVFHEGLSMVMDKKKKYGYIDKKGTLVIPCCLSNAHPFSGGRAEVKDEAGNEFFINASGKIVKEIRILHKEKKRLEKAKEKRQVKKQEDIEQKKSMLRDFAKKYGVSAQFIYVRNRVRTTNLFVVPAIKGQVVSFYSHKDFQRDYYERAMQFVEFLNDLTTTYGKSKIQKTESLPQKANDALQAKLEELQLKDLWMGIFNESQRHYLDGKYKIVAAI